jgi:hypothetical protein
MSNRNQWRVDLRDLLDNHFNVSGLKQLCFALNIDYEHLSRDNKLDTIISLIGYCERYQRLNDLAAVIARHRPKLEQTLREILASRPQGETSQDNRAVNAASLRNLLARTGSLNEPQFSQLKKDLNTLTTTRRGAPNAPAAKRVAALIAAAGLSDDARRKAERLLGNIVGRPAH